jgi:hypothetical protein
MIQNSIHYKNFDSQRRFGVELELGDDVKKKAVHVAIAEASSRKVFVSKYALTSNNQYWHVKDDATCGRKGRFGPKGVEVASFIGSGVSDLDHISDIAVHLAKVGCKTNDNCGLHIHAEVVDLTIDQISTIVAYWVKIEHVLSMILPIRRYHSEYCKFIFSPFLHVIDKNSTAYRQQRYSSDEFWRIVTPKNFSLFENNDRRYNLNLVNVARSLENNSQYRKTIELRWPEGTLDPIDIKCWVRLFISFIENCKDKPMPENLQTCTLREAIGYLGVGHSKNKFLILCAELHEMKTWFCERIIKFNQDSSVYYSHYMTAKFQADTVIEAKKILNEMLSPVKTFT